MFVRWRSHGRRRIDGRRVLGGQARAEPRGPIVFALAALELTTRSLLVVWMLAARLGVAALHVRSDRVFEYLCLDQLNRPDGLRRVRDKIGNSSPNH